MLTGHLFLMKAHLFVWFRTSISHWFTIWTIHSDWLKLLSQVKYNIQSECFVLDYVELLLYSDICLLHQLGNDCEIAVLCKTFSKPELAKSLKMITSDVCRKKPWLNFGRWQCDQIKIAKCL